MKKLFFLLITVFFAMYLPAQTIVTFHENFELPTLGDSIQNSTDPVGGTPWSITTNLKNSGLRADSNKVQIGSTVYLTTNSFSTLGYSIVSLQFAQICKLYFSDGGQVEISTDGGSVWTSLGPSQYLGAGNLITSGGASKFSESSYPTDWLSGDTVTKPTNSWWKIETFNLSTLAANQANVKIRFRFMGSGNPLGAGRYGWLLDDIKVFASNNELVPPRITFKTPILKDTVYVTGPFTVNAWVKDNTALNGVYINYSIDGGTFVSTLMNFVSGSDSLYKFDFPSMPYNSTICYSIEAYDIYNNVSYLPTSNCQQVLIKKGVGSAQIGNGTLSGFNSPIYINSATTTSLYSYYAAIITKSEIQTGGTIESIAFNKSDANGYNLSNATMRIYLKSTSDVITPLNYVDYTNAKATATKVYESTTQNLNTAAGWQTFLCNTGNLLTYAGTENLMVFVEFYHPGNATGAVNWLYETVTGKASSFYGTAVVPSSSNTTGQRAHIKINFESSVFALDSKVSEFVNPINTVIANTTVPISVKIKNLGNSLLTSAVVNWSVDGIIQNSSIWNGNLNQDYISSTVNLGNFSFPLGPHTIKAWTELPNNIADENPANDTLNISIYSCQNITGVFTVGNATADYPTFNDLFIALGNCGVNGPVTFKIKSGTYNQQLIIPLINNVSATNTVTFESETGNPNDVNFIYAATGASDNYVLKFDGSKYVKVKNVNFKANGASYGYVAFLANAASYNSMEGCKLEMPTTTSANYAGIYNANTFTENYNTFKNNTILNGYYGVYASGISTSNKEKGNIYEGNSISGFYNSGLYLNYLDSIIVLKNNVSNPSGASAYAIYSYYVDNAKYQKNKLIMTAATSNYCLYLYYNNTTSGNSLISNNFMSQSVGVGPANGLYSSYSKGLNIYNNSINVTKGTASGYALYVGNGASINLFNNIISNTGGGYAYYSVTSTSGIDSSNYNNIYATGANIGYWGTACSSFAALKTASGKEQNSLNLDPLFMSSSDLHCSNFQLGSKAKSLADVTDDIDGDVRTTPPCIGADEFPVPLNEAGVYQINQPPSMISVLNQDIKVTIQSLGQSPLTSVTINWSVNGVLKTPYTYSGNILQFGVDSVVIGNHTFSNGYSQIKVWTSSPNGVLDTYNFNDTLYKSVFACSGQLAGNYTIGGSSADYVSVEAAVSSLQCGISAAVVFNINPGTYTGQYIINNVPGSSVTNTITFQSANNDSTSVIFQYNAQGMNDNYLVKFNAANYLIFKGITFNALSNIYAKLISIEGNSSNISLLNNIFNGTQTNRISNDQTLITSFNTSSDSAIFISKNVLNYGYSGIYIEGVSTANLNKGIVISYNNLYDQSFRSAFLSRLDAVKFYNNNITTATTNTTSEGVYLNQLKNKWEFYNNKIALNAGPRSLAVWYCNSSYGNEALFYNNMISQGGTTSGHMIDYANGTGIKFYHNTFHRYGAQTTAGEIIFLNYYSDIANQPTDSLYFYNNIIVNSSGNGYLIKFGTGGASGSLGTKIFFDYNDYYTNAATFCYKAAEYASLTAWKTLNSYEVHGVNINPQFLGNNNLHISNYSLKNKGVPLPQVTKDIDDELRSLTTPDVGADELQIYNNDAGIAALSQNTICTGNVAVYAKLKNYGANNLNNVIIGWSVNGVIQTPIVFSASLLTFTDTTLNLGNYNFLPMTSYNVNFWTSTPNGVVDANFGNDTLKLVNLYTGLNGTYTVGDATANFLNLNTAINFMTANGICGPVVLNVKPGTYIGRYTIPAILGSSAINTLTIKSLNNDSTSVVFAASATATTDNWIVKLDGAKYTTIKNIKFTPQNASYANAIVITNSSKYNTITGNFLSSAYTGTTADLSLLRSEDINSTDNLIVANHFLGGSNGILIKGVSTTSRLDRVYVAKNLIEGFLQYGIRCEYANSPVIDSNIVLSDLSGTTTRNGISLSYAYDSLKVIKNRIVLSNSSILMGIALENTTSTATTKALIANNFVTLLNGTTQTYAMRLYPNINYLLVANNSVYVDGSSNTDTRGINPVSGSNIEVYNNNILSNKYTLFYENSCVSKSDRNNLYSTSNLYGYFNGTSILNYTSLAAYVTATLKDSNSVAVTPGFISSTDLHTDNIDLFFKGKFLSNVTKDIDNQQRASIPCIGADEFTVLPNDGKLRALYTLGNLPKQAGSPHIVKAVVKNIGSTVLSNINVDLNITGSNSFSSSKIITSLGVGVQDTINFDPFIPANLGVNNVKVNISPDNDLTNNEANYIQYVTDTIFGYADTTKATTNFGFGTGSGLMLAKYYINGSKVIKSVKAYITNNNTIGKQVYAVVLNSNGIVIDSSYIKTITASDTSSWVKFDMIHPPSTSTGNAYFYAGIAQIGNAYTFNPLGSQTENPARNNAYYTAAINGSGLTARTDIGRLMINVNIGNPAQKDAAMNIISTPNSGCGLFSEIINVVIQNKGTDTIFGTPNALTVKYGLKYNGNIINIVSQPLSDTIAPAAIKNISFNVPVNFVTLPQTDSIYHIASWTQLTNDNYGLNDTIFKDVLVKYTPAAPAVNSISIPYATAGTLNAISSDTIYWFHQAVGGTKIAQGNTYTSGILYSNDTIWSQAFTKFAALATIGTGTSVNTTTTFPAPYGNYWWGSKHQILITKAELNSFGIVAGQITSLAFQVTSAAGASLQNFEIKMKNTTSSALATGAYETNLTSVYTNASYTTFAGWNTHIFTTPFYWNGIDNILVETCFNNSSYTTNAIMSYTPTSFNSVAYSYGDNANNCSNATSTYVSVNRPNIQINYNKDGCESVRTKTIITVAPPPANEAGLLAFTNPTGAVPSNTLTDVKVMLKNFGLQPITSFKINYKLNNVLQPQFQWNNPADPVLPGASREFTIGSFMLPGGLDTLIAWSSEPNNVQDPNPLNDTTKLYFSSCMNGTFTIGVGKNYPNFTSALNALNGAGVCGNVTFLVDSGNYEERLFINPITGAGPNARITFTSVTGDSTDVVLHYSLSSAAAWAMKFIGSSYFSFSKMTLSIAGSNTWGRIMELGPNSHHIEISNCVIEGMQGASNNYSLIYMSGAGLNYNTIKNNLMLNGYQVIYAYGTSTSNYNIKNTISNNILRDFNYYGIYAYYQDSISIVGNTIQNIASATYAYAIYSAYCNNNSYLKNKISVNATYNYPMYLYYCNSTSGNGLVANNFISQSVGVSTTYGMYVNYSNNLNIYYNSINITGVYTSNYAFYIYAGSNNNVVNNIFCNTGGGYAYYSSSTAGVAISNYNDLYVTGTNLGYWGTTTCTSLAAFKTASGKEANSLNVNPSFFGIDNLHMINFQIDKMGTPLAQVSDDVDGEVRNVLLPDIGADEFVLPNNDAGVLSMNSPLNPASAGSQAVKVVIKNWGVLNLTSAVVNWSVNGILQTPSYSWTGNKISGEVDTILLGNYNFTAGQSLMKFWTTLPNNVPDQLTMNDTLTTSIIVCAGPLSGNYTLGGSSANFATFNGAVMALQMCGISGPVTFNVNPGYYNEQFVIPVINGSSATNRVTFQSANGDSSSVVIGFNFTQTNNNYVIQFVGTQYVTIKGMTIRQTNSSSGRVINFTGNPSNIIIKNNRIEMPLNTAGTTAGIVTLNADYGNDNQILNNNISSGYNGIVIIGSASAITQRNIVKGNIITGFYNYGIQCTYSNSPVIDSNTVISSVTGTGTKNGILLNNVTDSLKVTRNSIVLSNSTNTNGILFETVTSTATARGLIANNFVSLLNGTNYTYGLRLYPINYVLIANNSIFVNGSSTTDTRGINSVNGANNEVYNNNVVCNYYPNFYENNSIGVSNYNNFYSTTGQYGYYNGSATVNYTSLSALSAAYQKDFNSVSYDPDFISNTNLHVYTSAVNNLAMPLAYVTNDIDGQPRNANTPDIGADEFTPLPVDLSVTAFLLPTTPYSQVGVNIPIRVRIKNYGADSIANFNVVCKVGNAAPIVHPYTTYLLSNRADSVDFLNVVIPAGASEIKAYISLTTDLNHLNDTSKMNYFGVPLKSVPYAENFDNTTQEWFTSGIGSLWEKGVPAASVINTPHSAPNVWATKLNGNYTNNNISMLYTPIFNNSLFKADTLKFWHWVDAETNKDGGYIEYKNNMDNWVTLGHILPDTNSSNWYNGATLNMWTGIGAGWQQSKYKLSKLTDIGNTVQFRFVFKSDATNSTYNGWAIDDFALTLNPIPQDAGVVAITSPLSTSLVGEIVLVSVTVKNFGTDSLFNIPVSYQAGTSTAQTAIITGSLAPGATKNHTFSQQLHVANASFNLCASTSVLGDIYTQNDQFCKSITVNPAANDVGITEIIQPGSTVSPGSTLIKAVIKNFGTVTQTSIPVSYQRNALTPVDALWTGSLASGDTVQYTFPSPMNVPSGVSFSLNVFTRLSLDAYLNNDSIKKSVDICNLSAPGAIVGTASVNAGSNNVMYRITSLVTGALYYNWYYTGTGVSITPDLNNKDTVYLSFTSSATSGILSVRGWNGTCEGAAANYNIGVVGIDDIDGENFWLGQNIPNPTNSSTYIEYSLPSAGNIKFDIMNLYGQKVYSINEKMDAGKHFVNLNVKELSAGIYYYTIEFKGKRLVKKMVVNK
ncbi:MAG: T9SS type A sorting domain-containing protein [Bacteroidales bacterium]